MAKTKTKASFFIFECHRATVLVSSSLLTRDRSSCYHCANNSTDKEQRSKNWKKTKSWKSNKNTRVIKTGVTAKQANLLRPEQINSNLMWRCQLFRCKQAAFFILHRTSQRGYILKLCYQTVILPNCLTLPKSERTVQFPLRDQMTLVRMLALKSYS